MTETVGIDEPRMEVVLRAKRLAMLAMALNLLAGAMGVFGVGGTYPLFSPEAVMSLLFLNGLAVLGLAMYIPQAVRSGVGEASTPGPEEVGRKWAWRSLLSVDLIAAFGGISVFLTWNGLVARPLLVLAGMGGIFVLGAIGFVVLRRRVRAGWAWGAALLLGAGPFIVQGLSRYGFGSRGALVLVLLLYPVTVPIVVAVDLLLLDGLGDSRGELRKRRPSTDCLWE